MDYSQALEKRLTSIKSEIPQDCKVIAVSKVQSHEKIKAAYDLGHRKFGENKVQEAIEKWTEFETLI